MTYRVIIAPAAENDLRTTYRYIRSQAPRAARDWIRRARRTARSLAHHPERCPMAPESASFDQPFANCFSARAIAARTVSCLSCLLKRNRFIFSTFGMDPCFRSDLTAAFIMEVT